MEIHRSKTKDKLVLQIRDWFRKNGDGCKAIIGVRGDLNGAVCSALCLEALGKDRVIDVIMPNLDKVNFDDNYKFIDTLKIGHYTISISVSVASIYNQIEHAGIKISYQSAIDLPEYIRMAILSVIAQSINGQIVCTSNTSNIEDICLARYSNEIRYLSPLKDLSEAEINNVAKELALSAFDSTIQKGGHL